MFTSNLRRHHAEILGIVGQIVPMLKPQIDIKSAEQLRKLLVELSARVATHLTSEDKVLYPKLVGSKNAKASSTATRFSTEMGTIGVALKEYLGKYPTPETIAKDGAKFSSDTKAIFGALGNRIEREEKELYPLADAEAA